MKSFLTNNSQKTQKFGESFAKTLKSGDVILLYGDLGAGKTTLVQGIAKGMGIEERIISPTFVLIRIHLISSGKIKKLNHIDLYRLEGKTEIKNLGLGELIEEEGVVSIIEWADRLTDFKPTKGYKIYLDHVSENERKIRVENI